MESSIDISNLLQALHSDILYYEDLIGMNYLPSTCESPIEKREKKVAKKKRYFTVCLSCGRDFSNNKCKYC